jgi:hypothetical protein
VDLVTVLAGAALICTALLDVFITVLQRLRPVRAAIGEHADRCASTLMNMHRAAPAPALCFRRPEQRASTAHANTYPRVTD